jgi:hypothetical protein
VLLRTLFRHPALPPSARLALRIESGMNDVILLPIVVLCMLLLSPESAAPAVELGRRAVGLFILGPLLGVFSGWVAITLLDTVRKKVGVRRDYESLYALGVAFTAYAAAEAVGGSGFLAAFAAGLVIAALDVELCDCFLDYGEASAEMFCCSPSWRSAPASSGPAFRCSPTGACWCSPSWRSRSGPWCFCRYSKARAWTTRPGGSSRCADPGA